MLDLAHLAVGSSREAHGRKSPPAAFDRLDRPIPKRSHLSSVGWPCRSDFSRLGAALGEVFGVSHHGTSKPPDSNLSLHFQTARLYEGCRPNSTDATATCTAASISGSGSERVSCKASPGLIRAEGTATPRQTAVDGQSIFDATFGQS